MDGPHVWNLYFTEHAWATVSRFLWQENKKMCDVGRVGKRLLIQIRFSHRVSPLPANKYMHKVNNGNNRKRFEIYLKLTMKTPERRQ